MGELQLTREQVLSLAPDAQMMRTGWVLAVPEKWQQLGVHGSIAWGTFPVPNREPFQVAVELKRLQSTCSCKNRRFPCNHALALLLLAVEHTERLEPSEPSFAVDLAPKPAEAVPTDQEIARRHRRLMQGLHDFERRLHDVVRSGLIGLENRPVLSQPKRPKDHWKTASARLVDVRATALAAEVQSWAGMEPEPLLRRMGRLQMLIAAFDRFDEQPVAVQRDLWRAVGWEPLPHEDDETVRDTWQVLGNRTVPLTPRRRILETILLGKTSGRFALVEQSSSKQKQPERVLLAGTELDAEMRFFVSRTPLAAKPVAVHGAEQMGEAPANVHSVERFSAETAHRLSVNPWLHSWPVVIRPGGMRVVNGAAYLLDRAGGMLPISPANTPSNKESHIWHLAATESAPLCAIWNGSMLIPLSLWVNGRLLNIKLLKGVA